MNRTNILGGALVLAVGAVATWFILEYMTTDEVRVRRVVEGVLEAIEDKDRTGVCQHMTADYHDGHGHDSRAELRETLRGLPIVRSIEMEYEGLTITVEGETARAEFMATVIAHQAGRSRAWTHRSRVRLHFRKVEEDGKWRVQQAEYNIPANVIRSMRMID